MDFVYMLISLLLRPTCALPDAYANVTERGCNVFQDDWPLCVNKLTKDLFVGRGAMALSLINILGFSQLVTLSTKKRSCFFSFLAVLNSTIYIMLELQWFYFKMRLRKQFLLLSIMFRISLHSRTFDLIQ